MVPLQSVLFALFAALLIRAAPSPVETRDLLGEVIDALGIGLVTHIDVTLTVLQFRNSLGSRELITQSACDPGGQSRHVSQS
jgi:hypothetical protein